jgi:putative ABC transport system ATP-binding protein
MMFLANGGGMFGRSKTTSTLSKADRNGHLIIMHAVAKTFKTAAGPFTALKNVDLRVNRGEFVAIIGKSGSGKSTLLNMLTGIDRPTSGEVYVGETPVHTLSEGQMAKWRGRNLGIVFQFFQLLPTLSLVENIMLPMDFCHMYAPRERKRRAMELLDMVKMTQHANKLPSAISGGQQQRVAIARALANDPPIIVADEPTGNLDSKTAEHVFELFEGLVQQGKTIVMVTHDSDKAKRVHRAVIVSDGEVLEEYLARAFSTLSQEQLIWASHNVEPEQHEPGSIVFHSGSAPDQFYIITRGAAEVVLRTPDGQNIVAARLTPGQYFGEIALLRGTERTATVRAALDTGVEVITLDRNTFNALMAQSEPTRESLDETADRRYAETEALLKKK